MVAKRLKEVVDGLWWLFVLQGVMTVLFGLVALFFPGLTLAGLVYLFAIFTALWGVIELVRGFTHIGKVNSWWVSLLFGLVAVGVGVYLINNPHVVVSVLAVIVGAMILVRSLVDLYLAAFTINGNENRVLWGLIGVLGVIAAIVIWRYPVSSGVAFVWVLGLYAILTGSLLMAYAFRVRSLLED